VTVKGFLRGIIQAPWPRVLGALLAATLAVLIDLMLRFSDYRLSCISSRS